MKTKITLVLLLIVGLGLFATKSKKQKIMSFAAEKSINHQEQKIALDDLTSLQNLEKSESTQVIAPEDLLEVEQSLQEERISISEKLKNYRALNTVKDREERKILEEELLLDLEQMNLKAHQLIVKHSQYLKQKYKLEEK